MCFKARCYRQNHAQVSFELFCFRNMERIIRNTHLLHFICLHLHKNVNIVVLVCPILNIKYYHQDLFCKMNPEKLLQLHSKVNLKNLLFNICILYHCIVFLMCNLCLPWKSLWGWCGNKLQLNQNLFASADFNYS